MAAWHEDDDFWITFGAWLFRPERVADARNEVESVIRLLELAPGERVLDLCCGVGRHSLEFARRGFGVTGVDRTQSYLDRARRQAASEGLAVEFILADARSFDRPASFDGAVNLFTSFGYFEDPADDLRVARTLYASLKPGRRLVLDVLGKEVLARNFRELVWTTSPDGKQVVLQEHSLRSGWDWIDNHWIHIDGSTRTDFRFGHRLYSGAELAGVLKQAGFRSVALYGNLAAIPYDHKAERLVAVAQK